jgi:para-nitrobenzyl esterase
MDGRMMPRTLALAIAALLACGGCSDHGSNGNGDGGSDGAVCGSDVPNADGVVHTESGAVMGALEANTWAYKGIPFAAPPVGELRWKPPAAHACWQGALATTAFGKQCLQEDANGNLVGDEDCLQLNVWTPVAAQPGPLPVLVFVHGGGNSQGSASTQTQGVDIYDGQYIAEHGPAVVVTTNYRLGILGFFAHASLDAESDAHVSGNYGMLDQIAALKWVQNNIAGFGGDPKRVLLFGESAGAVDTCVHLASPLSAGLFSAALMESGGCGDPTLASYETSVAPAVDTVGCGGNADIPGCMRALPASTLVKMVPGVVSVTGLDTGIKFGPNVDGKLLTDSPLAVIAAGKHNAVPFVIGANSDETSRYAPMVPDATVYAELVHTQFGTALGDLVLNQYPASAFATPRKAYIAVTTDARFVCPSRRIARTATTSQSAKVFRYFFTHALDNAPAQQPLGAWHGLELTFVFHHLMIAGYTPSPAENALSDAIIGYWTRFAATGNPNGAGAVDWPTYEGNTDPVLALDDTTAVMTGVRSAHCDFWDGITP